MRKSDDMERGEYIRELEKLIPQFQQDMHQAAMRKDSQALTRLSQGFNMAQTDWLQVARGMSLEKARAVMVGFAMGELTKWMEERRPGPPPSVLTLYEGPISDEDYGKALERNRND